MTGRDPIDELAEEFLTRFRRGERPALSEFIARRPDLAEDIRDLFPALVMMEEAGPGDPSRSPSLGQTPGRLGDYRILREVGRGGMGIVFEAVQESLGRHVALKVMPADAAEDMTSLTRFSREARAAARLHHTNIVPVYDIGAHDGSHYYSMQLIRGQSLDEVLAELRRLRHPETDSRHTCVTEEEDVRSVPLAGSRLANGLLTGTFARDDVSIDEPLAKSGTISDRDDPSNVSASAGTPYHRGLARIGLQVAEALAYAHGQGVLHRDVKPSNLLLDQHGVVWVSDFGLAKEEGQSLTRTGNVVGTLRYLPPERFHGVSDPRGDVYSLGLTLYEMVTLRPAFDEADQVKLLQNVAHGEPPPPRRFDRQLPRDLETIVLKAMAREPGRRYQTAEGMAADLRHFLADEPILARRSTWLEQVTRLGRRNPVVTGLSAAVAVLAAVSLVVVIVASLLEGERAKAVFLQQRAELAEKEALAAKTEIKIREHLARATAARRGGQVGQRFQTLAELSLALQLDPSPELRREIRDEAVAALVLPDAEIAHEWEGFPEGSVGLAFDADFHRYARLDKQGGITVCRLSDGREKILARLPAHGQPKFHHIWMSPDGRFVAYGHSCLRESVPAGVRVWKLDGPDSSVLLDVAEGMNEMALAFRRDSRQLAIGHADGTVSVYDLASGGRVWRFEIGVAPRHLAFHPKDGRLAVAAGDAVRLFDSDTGRELPALRHAVPVTWTHTVSWHPDGRRLATGCNDRQIHIWDTETAAEVMAPWTGHTNDGIHLAFNHAGDRLVSFDWGTQYRLWDVGTGRILLTMPGYNGWQFSPDDRLLGYGVKGTKVRLLRLANGRELRVLRRRGADRLENITHPVVHPDGRTLAACSHHDVSFFDLVSGEELASVRLPRTNGARPVFFDRFGGWMTGGFSGLCLWPTRSDPDRPEVMDIGPPRQLAPDSGVGYTLSSTASADGLVVAAPQGDSTLVLHRDRAEGTVRRRVVLGPQYDVRFSAVSPDGRWVVTCSHFSDGRSKTALIWDAATGQQVHALPMETSSSARFSPDGLWLLTAAAHDYRLWEAGTWREVRRLEGTGSFSPDSRWLALNDVFGVIRLVETATGDEVARLTSPEPMWYSPACFTPDGTRLVATGGGETALYVWDLRSIREQLKEWGLNWNGPEFPAAPPQSSPPVIRVNAGDARQDVAISTVTLALQPMNPDAWLQRGRAWGRLKEDREAIADYSAVLALAPPNDPRRAEALLCRANSYARLPDQARMLADLLELAKVEARFIPLPKEAALSCNNAAWGLCLAADEARQPAVALVLARKAVELEPDDGSYRNTLGVALYRDGQYRPAVATLQANATNAAFAGWDLYFLAMAFHQLQEKANARASWDRAVRWHQEKEGDLSQPSREELAKFRAEAEALLGHR